MNVLIVGAGASYATHRLPVAGQALSKWSHTIQEQHKLLAFALDTWVSGWPEKNLEEAWTQIDVAWKERAAGASQFAVRDLTDSQRRKVWRLAFEAKAVEAPEPNYYRTQLEWAQTQGYSTEQFLTVVAGWELRRLIQQEFDVTIKHESRGPYERLLRELQPTKVISFNYDTLLEQCLEQGTWTYSVLEEESHQILILKPHGSVNWTHHLSRTRGLTDQVSFDTTLSPEDMGYRGGWLVQNLVIGLRDKIEHTPAERSPILRTLFLGILMACERVLVDAEKIWVVGYRFAAADTSFLDVLARSLARRARPPSLSVISRDQNELQRIQDLFTLTVEHRISHCFCGLEIWDKHGFSCA